MHRRVVAALLLAGLVSAGQVQDAKVLGRARAINPATPKAAAAPDPPATDPAPPDAAIPDEPTEEPQPEPAKPEPTPSQSSSDSKGATSDSPSSDTAPSASSTSPDDSLTPTGSSNSSSTTAIAPSSSSVPTSMPRGASGPTPALPDNDDDESSSTSTNTTTTSTTDSSRTTSSKTSTTTKKTTTPRPTSTSSSAPPRVDDTTTTKTTPKPSSTSKSSRTTTRSRTRSSSAPHSSAPDHSTTSATESGTADDFKPVPTPNESPSDVAAKEDDPVSSPSPQGPADNNKALPDSRQASSGLLHNKQATALVFTFSALILVALCGIVFWLCRRRRSRDRHVMLDEKDDAIAFRRANSTASRSSRGARRPTSMISVTSSGNTHESQGWHYMPARFAGIQPIRQPSTLDAAAGQIAQDPFAVHRVVYPDMPPQPASPTFTLYPDPVPPPPPPPQRASSTRVPPPRPTSLSPDLGLAGAASRPRSPESHYGEESVYTGTQRRPYMIERRPERRRVDE